MPQKFQVQLAASEIPKPEDLKFELYASVKFDGIRIAITDGCMMSRKMLPIPNKAMQEWSQAYAEHLEGFDCEGVVGPPNLPSTMQTSSSGINKVTGTPDFKLYVFDLWNEPKLTRVERMVKLIRRIALLPPAVRSRVEYVNQEIIENLYQLRGMYKRVTDEGYEGLIMCDPKALYKYGRSTLKQAICMKWKEFDSSEYKIIGFKQGKKNNNPQVRDELGKAKRSSAKAGKVAIEELGSFLGIDVNPASPFFQMEIVVGPGSLTQAELREIWANRESYLGRIGTYEYQVVGVKTKPRYPRHKAFKPLVDLSDEIIHAAQETKQPGGNASSAKSNTKAAGSKHVANGRRIAFR